jgi:TetR/AcrR family transcriptional regulator, transcriptional repressor for nem operon
MLAPGFRNDPARPGSAPARRLTFPSYYEMMAIMRYPIGHKEAVQERIVRNAAAAIRRHGLAGVSVPELMKGVGLTHGGFYVHFRNREELVARAVESAAGETAEAVFGEGCGARKMLESYLSPEHLKSPEKGCVVAALGADGARQAPAVRHAFERVANGLMKLVDEKIHPGRRGGKISDEALRLTATMVGAVVLGRLLRDPELVQRLLRAARDSASVA